MTVFVDTSALYGILDNDEAHHAAAVAIWTELLERERDLLTTNYVLLEIAVFLQNRSGLAALRSTTPLPARFSQRAARNQA